MTSRWDAFLSSLRGTPPGWLAGAALAVAALSVAMLPFRAQLGVLNVLLIFLLLIFVLALTVGLWPAVLAAVLGFLAFDFLFIPPYLHVHRR